MENFKIKTTVNSNLTRPISEVIDHENNITKIESNAILVAKNESRKISTKRRKLDFHNETISENKQKSRRDFIEENKDLEDITYYFEKGRHTYNFYFYFILFISKINFF